jgi:hypothetical protein
VDVEKFSHVLSMVFWPIIWWFYVGLYALGACVVFYYISIPVWVLVNYLFFLFLKKNNKYLFKKIILFNLCLLILSPLGLIIGEFLCNLFRGAWDLAK